MAQPIWVFTLDWAVHETWAFNITVGSGIPYSWSKMPMNKNKTMQTFYGETTHSTLHVHKGQHSSKSGALSLSTKDRESTVHSPNHHNFQNSLSYPTQSTQSQNAKGSTNSLQPSSLLEPDLLSLSKYLAAAWWRSTDTGARRIMMLHLQWGWNAIPALLERSHFFFFFFFFF